MKKTLKIHGMHCKACKMLIEDIASDINGIESCTVDADKGTATVLYQTPKALSQLKAEIISAGPYSISE